jgi:hypothetical protein
MTADQVVVLDVLISESQKVARDEVQPLAHIGWLERRSSSRGLQKRVGDVETDDTVTETGKCNCLCSLSAPGVKHPQRLTQGGKVGGKLATDQFLPHRVANQAEARQPRVDGGLEPFGVGWAAIVGALAPGRHFFARLTAA